jgi:hypothetical protein
MSALSMRSKGVRKYTFVWKVTVESSMGPGSLLDCADPNSVGDKLIDLYQAYGYKPRVDLLLVDDVDPSFDLVPQLDANGDVPETVAEGSWMILDYFRRKLKARLMEGLVMQKPRPITWWIYNIIVRFEDNAKRRLYERATQASQQ